jgi:hypothetical protein
MAKEVAAAARLTVPDSKGSNVPTGTIVDDHDAAEPGSIVGLPANPRDPATACIATTTN